MENPITAHGSIDQVNQQQCIESLWSEVTPTKRIHLTPRDLPDARGREDIKHAALDIQRSSSETGLEVMSLVKFRTQGHLPNAHI
jgi:hypothetical protein